MDKKCKSRKTQYVSLLNILIYIKVRIIIFLFRTADSLSDTILSMTLCDHIKNESAHFTNDKLHCLHDILNGREITIIKPKRPDRKGLKSEVVMEKKLYYCKFLFKIYILFSMIINMKLYSSI